jgi:hypothetical protein
MSLHVLHAVEDELACTACSNTTDCHVMLLPLLLPLQAAVLDVSKVIVESCVGCVAQHAALAACKNTNHYHVALLLPLQAAVLDVAKVIVESCRNLLQFLEDLAITNGVLSTADTTTNGSSSTGSNGEAAVGGSSAANGSSSGSNAAHGSSSSSQGAKFKAVLAQHVQSEGVIEWLVPPMLQGANVDVDGWV